MVCSFSGWVDRFGCGRVWCLVSAAGVELALRWAVHVCGVA